MTNFLPFLELLDLPVEKFFFIKDDEDKSNRFETWSG